jgi:hypothetical protein
MKYDPKLEIWHKSSKYIMQTPGEYFGLESFLSNKAARFVYHAIGPT